MKTIISNILVISALLVVTVAAYGGCYHGWFLSRPLDKPVSLRDGSARVGRTGLAYYFLGRSHYGGGYRGGK